VCVSKDLESRELAAGVGPIPDEGATRRPVPLASGLAAVALSAGALALLVHLYVPAAEGAAVEPVAAPAPRPTSAPVPASDPPAASAPRPASRDQVLALAGDVSVLATVAAGSSGGARPSHGTAPAPSREPDTDAELVSVPDLTDLRVPQARRAARALGLRLVVRDTYGSAIDTFYAPRYRIRSQRVPADQTVPRGTEVRALAEDPAPIVSGY
jgi:hypothetical protein